MILIVGLGNPGSKFNHTRHNTGFEALDFFAQKNGFPEFKNSKKHLALVAKKDDVVLVKPQTFMNESGNAVKSLKMKAESLVVIHDDIDLELGKLKISNGSGAGGHKGVESIINALGTKDFTRFKIGIATGEHKAEEVVLKKFTPGEQTILQPVIEKTAQALDYFIEHGLEKTMNEYNR